MGSIEEIYRDLEVDVSEAEFREAVEEKVEQMAGLADEETAAMLIAHELSDREINGITDIEPGMEEVQFLGKVITIGDIRTFERDDGSEGQVVNVELRDETGGIRAAFWDDYATAAKEELEVGQVLRIQGRPRDGYNGIEVSVDRVEPDDETEIEVPVTDAYNVEDLTVGHSDVTIRGRVLGTDSIRTFDRDDGTEGRVANLVIGDETGRVRVTLWDDRADVVDDVRPGESVEVINGYVRERDDQIELHVGNRGVVEHIDEEVVFVPDAAEIASVETGETVDIAGVVRSVDPVRTFDRDDGTEGQVKNIRVQDKTGDLRVALWGEKADVDVQPGDEVHLADLEIREGWQEEIEGSAGWQATISVLDDGIGERVSRQSDNDQREDSSGAMELSSFGDDTPDQSDDDPGSTGEITEFTGVVVQTGSPIILDDGEQTMTVETDQDVVLGEELTIKGRVVDGTMDAEEVR